MRSESEGEPKAQFTDRTSSPLPPREPGEDRLGHGSRWEDPAPQYLLSEDRQEYERILDEALRSAPHRPELAAVGRR
ncbi:hypothetical protein ACFVZI_39360, partial [Streptomyces mirabilis]